MLLSHRIPSARLDDIMLGGQHTNIRAARTLVHRNFAQVRVVSCSVGLSGVERHRRNCHFYVARTNLDSQVGVRRLHRSGLNGVSRVIHSTGVHGIRTFMFTAGALTTGKLATVFHGN